jgi:hypothetical protein
VHLRTIAFVAFAAHDVERARRPLVHAGAIDIATVDVIARLRLRARRAGLELRLYDPVPELAELLGLTGMDTLVG